MKKLKEFLTKIHVPGTLIQYGEVNNVMHLSGKEGFGEFIKNNEDKNLYFLANVSKDSPMRSKTKEGKPKDPTKNRASDIDIIQKRYVYFDFDIRSEIEKQEKSISDDDIKQVGHEMGKQLKEHEEFKDFFAIVFTGNGLHVYYTGNIHEFDSKAFSYGYEVFAKKMSAIVSWQADMSCKNPARIARIPETYNNKKEKKKAEIIFIQDAYSGILGKILEEGRQEVKRQQEIGFEEEAYREYKVNMCKYSGEEIITKIDEIPVEEEVSRDFSNWSFDGKNWSDSKGLSAAFKPRDKNILIISDSRHFAHIKYKGVGTFLYRREYSKLTNKQALDYFFENYPSLERFNTKPEKIDLPKKSYTWGTGGLQDKFAGIRRGIYTVISGETNDGKTTFAFWQAIKNAEQGNKVLYVSLEMDNKEILESFGRSYAGITEGEENNNRTPEYKITAKDRRINKINSYGNLVVEGIRKGNETCLEDIEKMIIKHSPDIVYIDNLDLVCVKDTKDDFQAQRLVSKGIMSMTSRLQIPIILLHHFRKKSTADRKSNGKRTLDDLGGSRKIAHDADRIIVLLRNHKEEATDEERASLTLFLDKARGYSKRMHTVYFYKGDFYDEYPAKSELIAEATKIFVN